VTIKTKELNDSRCFLKGPDYWHWQQYCNGVWRMHRSGTAERVLIVEPDIERSEQLREAVNAISFLTVCHDFVDARRTSASTHTTDCISRTSLRATVCRPRSSCIQSGATPCWSRTRATPARSSRTSAASRKSFPVISARPRCRFAPLARLDRPKSRLAADENSIFQPGIPAFKSATEL
jgi:hypothetical protein